MCGFGSPARALDSFQLRSDASTNVITTFKDAHGEGWIGRCVFELLCSHSSNLLAMLMHPERVVRTSDFPKLEVGPLPFRVSPIRVPRVSSRKDARPCFHGSMPLQGWASPGRIRFVHRDTHPRSHHPPLLLQGRHFGGLSWWASEGPELIHSDDGDADDDGHSQAQGARRGKRRGMRGV